MLDRFGLDPDSRLALVVERAIQGAGIEVWIARRTTS